MADDRRTAQTERRFARERKDPSISPEAERLLTAELREATGRPDAELPADAPRRLREGPDHSPFVANLVSNRQLILVGFLAAVVVGGIIALTTGWYVAVLLAVALHALATLAVTAGVIQLTTEVEHVAPETAAALEEEGVADPDRVLTQLVEDVADEDQAGGVPEVVGSGNNERTVRAGDDPVRSTLEQRTAMTPQSSPGPSAGERSAIALLPWWLVIGVVAVSIAAVPAFAQGWLVPAILIPIGLGWIALQRWMAHDARSRSDRAPGDEAAARRRLLPIAAFVVIGAVWLMLILQLATGYA